LRFIGVAKIKTFDQYEVSNILKTCTDCKRSGLLCSSNKREEKEKFESRDCLGQDSQRKV